MLLLLLLLLPLLLPERVRGFNIGPRLGMKAEAGVAANTTMNTKAIWRNGRAGACNDAPRDDAGDDEDKNDDEDEDAQEQEEVDIMRLRKRSRPASFAAARSDAVLGRALNFKGLQWGRIVGF